MRAAAAAGSALAPRMRLSGLHLHCINRRCITVDTRKFTFETPQYTRRRGLGIVHDPISNKGTGFPYSERDRLHIRGLVPPRQLSLETQEQKVWHTINKYPNSIEKYMYLCSLQDRNETLFFRTLIDHLDALAPVVYTPTVGEVCKKFGSFFQRPRGMYYSSMDRGLMSTMVWNWPQDEVEIIVVTDGSRILGLGDLGANGMGIPIGKLALYVAAGGIHPRKVLPVMLDAGTDNVQLRSDPWYLGMTHPRLKGDEYFSLVHEFVKSAHHRWPNAVIQFEDFSSDKAMGILEAYRYDHLCFNDDISGTGSVCLAAVLAAIRVQGASARLRDQRIVVAGAGSAGMGVAQALYDAMLLEGAGPDEAREAFWVLDKDGLLGPERPRESLTTEQAFFARPYGGGVAGAAAARQRGKAGHQTSHPSSGLPGEGLVDGSSLLDTVLRARPTILLGLTGMGGTFTEAVVRGMAGGVERPIVMPLSNPTSNAECTAEQALQWSDGRAMVATGSPSAPVTIGGRTFHPSQVNNMFVFPGVGLGAVVIRAKRITDRMFYAASKALADMVTEDQLAEGMVLPQIKQIREVSARVAAAVAASGIADGIVQRMPPAGDLVEFMTSNMYDPRYVPLVEA